MQRATGALVMVLFCGREEDRKHKFEPCHHSSVMANTGVFIQFGIH